MKRLSNAKMKSLLEKQSVNDYKIFCVHEDDKEEHYRILKEVYGENSEVNLLTIIVCGENRPLRPNKEDYIRMLDFDLHFRSMKK
jgi:hypothetical protein